MKSIFVILCLLCLLFVNIFGGNSRLLSAIGQQCGSVTCPKGTVCCNASCDWCVRPDMQCTQQVCESSEHK